MTVNRGKAAMRLHLRGLLYDAMQPYVWDDALLDEALDGAIARHSALFACLQTFRVGVSPAQKEFQVYAVVDANAEIPPEGSNVGTPQYGAAYADLLGIESVELPPGNPLAEDAWPTLLRPGSYAQAYRARMLPGVAQLTLRNGASRAEVGARMLQVNIRQTWNRPSENGYVAWNGPVQDEPLLYLLSRRGAYGSMAELNERNAYVAEPGERTPTLNIIAVLAGLDAEIASEIAVRRGRGVASRTLVP